MKYFNAESVKTLDLHPEFIFTEQFKIYDTSKILMKSRKITIITIEEAIKNIDSYDKTTGIMIGDFLITENNSLFLFIFDNIILLINEIDLHQFQLFFAKNKEQMTIFYLNTRCIEKIQKISKEKIIIQAKTDQKKQKNLPQLLLEKMSECIIKKSQLRTLNRYNGLIPNNVPIQTKFDKKDFINIIGFNGTNQVFLSYNIIDQFLYILKYFDNDSKKRFYREVSFYENHNGNNPYICKYYGSDYKNSIIFTEYIEGQTLKDFINNERERLSHDEKLAIILEIMSAIEYLHVNGFIYRDLKIDNIIIDYNHKATLIDFDQIKICDENQQTSDIGNDFYASPEQLSSHYYSFQTDIYSIGKVIEFIFSYCEKSEADWNFYNKYKYCMEKSPEKRPRIGNLLTNVFNFYLDSNNPQSYFKEIFEVRKKLFEFSVKTKINEDKIYDLYTFMGICYLDGNLISQDIEKAVKFLELASNKNDSDAQLYLGNLYLEDEYPMRNVTKAIRYLEHSSENNNSFAQLYLGIFYFDEEHLNVKIGIKYLELSSKNNNSEAQAYLGEIYYEGKYVQRNVERAIQLLELSSNQNNSKGQLILGEIYYKGEYVKRDVMKAIHYFQLSSDNNNSISQYYLGEIYYRGEFVFKNIDNAIKFSTLSANKHNSNAQCLLGKIYFPGNIEELSHNDIFKYWQINFFNENLQNSFQQTNAKPIANKYSNIKKSIYYLELSSNQNNSLAQFYLGYLYFDGKYVQQNIERAIILLELSANNNNLSAQYLLVNIFYSRGQYEKSIRYLELLAKQNDSDIQYILGMIYSFDNHVPHDFNKAIHYFTLSSNQNNSDAQFILGILYYHGKKIPSNILSHDINKAIEYFTLSSNQNNSEALFYLGMIYYKGEFVKQNIDKAMYYLKLSSDQNDPDAQLYLGVIYYENRYIPIDINKAIYYFTLSSNQNNSDALFYLGYIFYSEKYVKQNINKALLYFVRSSEQYNSNALFYLGMIYYDGECIPRDINKAIHYFKEASSLNDARSKNNLGVIFKNGDGVEKNIYHAIEYFEEAIRKKNDHYAMYNLAIIYYFGINIEPNIPKALELLEKLSKNNFELADIFLKLIILKESKKEICNKSQNNQINEFECIINYFKSKLNYFGNNLNDALFQFFKEFDLVYSDSNKYNINFLKNLFSRFSIQIPNKNNLAKNINKDFYEGFYND